MTKLTIANQTSAANQISAQSTSASSAAVARATTSAEPSTAAPSSAAPKYWRSLDHQRGYDQTVNLTASEFPHGLAPDAFAEGEQSQSGGLQRREALKLMGASMGLAGLTGCDLLRRPEDLILPYGQQPENLIPGVPNFYATAFPGPNGAVGMLVESHEGRPTKIEGNPDHPASGGKSDRFQQAEVLEMYDPDRSREPWEKGVRSTWKQFDVAYGKAIAECNGGAGLSILLDAAGGPTRDRVLHALRKKLPQAKVHTWEPLAPDNTLAGAELAFGPGQRVHLDLGRAQRIVAVDCDFHTEGPDSLRYTAGFAKGRSWDRMQSGADAAKMNRLYAIEAAFSTTGTTADHRLRVPRGQIGDALKALGSAILGRRQLPATFGGSAATSRLAAACRTSFSATNPKFIQALTNDLIDTANRGEGVAIVVGEGQPPAVHALAHLLNAALGAFEKSSQVATVSAAVAANKAKVEAFFATASSSASVAVDKSAAPGGEGAAPGDEGESAPSEEHWAFARPLPHVGSYASLALLIADLQGGRVKTLIVIGSNPAFAAPGALKVKEAFGKASTLIHAGLRRNETAMLAAWHVPLAHWLESWDDATSWDGSVSIVQPLIKPIHDARSGLELLAAVAGFKASGHDLVKETWQKDLGTIVGDKGWRQALHKGLLPEKARRTIPLGPVGDGDGSVNDASENDAFSKYMGGRLAQVLTTSAGTVATALGQIKGSAPDAATIEVAFKADFKVADGRYGNNAWLQELPDSMTKLCWDTALVIGPQLANELKIRSSVYKNSYLADECRLTVGDTNVVLPVFVLPGVAPATAVLAVGYGRKNAGYIGNDVGIDTWGIVPVDGRKFASAKLERTGRSIELCGTQEHFALEGAERKPLQDLDQLNKDLAKLRPIAVTGTAAQYAKNKAFAQKGSLRVVSRGKLVEPPERRTVIADYTGPAPSRPDRPVQPHDDVFKYDGMQWGMVIDLTTCTGCHACVIACQSENNIPIVGREQVLFGREMHWIRIDRYYVGDVDEPQALQQPVNCLHCENAPCEPVCPVAATVHSSEGVNGMIYNRCIGTRYCANNCPVKVRRFNYFDFTKTAHLNLTDEDHRRNQTIEMQRNPDVTVRFRGVIEKCSYCNQRINEAKMKAKREGQDSKKLHDGAIVPACAQSCPADAVTFGDVNDPRSRVAQMKVTDRNYEMLSELNIRGRTTYMARIRNSNQELG